MMAQGNLHSTSAQKVFYVYGIPPDELCSSTGKCSASVQDFFRQKGVKDFGVVGTKVKVVVHDRESTKTMRKKFSCFEGHDLVIKPELLKEVHARIDEEWIEDKDQFCQCFKTILQEIGVKVSVGADGLFLTGSFEDINRAKEIITAKIDTETLKKKLSTTARKMNGHGLHNPAESELAADSSAKDPELVKRGLANCQPYGIDVEKLLKGGVGSNGENSNCSESDKCDSIDMAVATVGMEATAKQSDNVAIGPQIEPNVNDHHSRNLSSSMSTNGMAKMIRADERVGARDQAKSNDCFNGSTTDACTISLEDFRLQFVEHVYPDMHEPLVKHPTLDMSVRSKNYPFLSDFIKKNKIDRVIKVIENPESVVSEFLKRSNALNILRKKCGGQLKLLVSDLSNVNGVQIVGLQEDIDMLCKEIDKWSKLKGRKQGEYLSLKEQHIKFISKFYPEIFESMDELFLLMNSDGVVEIFGASDDVDGLRNWIKEHLQMAEHERPTGVDENTCRALLSSIPNEVKIYLEFLPNGKILIVGSKEDIEKFCRRLETMNDGLKNLEQTLSSNGAVGPAGGTRTKMTVDDPKSNESIQSTSSGTDGRRLEVSKIIRLKDFQWKFTQHFHSDLYEQLTDSLEQNHKTKMKHYTHLLDMIKNNNIDRVAKVSENANNVGTNVLQRLADKLPKSLKVIVNFPSDDGVVEIIGLPEDSERWWILLRKEIDAYKRKMPPASHTFHTLEIKFIQTFHSEVYDYIKDHSAPEKSGKEIVVAGTFDELDKLKEWIRKHDIDRLESKVETMSNCIDEEDCREVHDSIKGQSKLCLSFPVPRLYEVIGFKAGINSFKDKLKQKEEVKKKNFLLKSTQTASSSRSESDSLHLYGATSSSDQEFVFQTPLSSIQVKIAKGDLTKQKTEAIVNPCNGRLEHFGGAAKAIADAAGGDLLDDCKKYLQKNKLLQTSEVMHTRSGRLNPPIKHVIHAFGPSAKAYPDSRKCQNVLEKTFYGCFACANDDLHVASLSVPAISSGTFGVPKDVVALSTWNALMRFDDQMSRTSNNKFLKVICFINIDKESTNSLIQTFRKNWNAYLLEQKSKVEAVQTEGSRKSSEKLRRSGSFSGTRTRLLKDQESVGVDIDKDGPSRTKTKRGSDSQESKSDRGATLPGVVPLIKGNQNRSASSVGTSSATESICCVCLKLKKVSSLCKKSGCPHKCCTACFSGNCQQCTRSTKIDSGPHSARSLVQSPTGGNKENDIGRRPESPEAMSHGNAKATRSRRLRRSTSVGDDVFRTKDTSGIDPEEERSENRAMSAAAASITNSQQFNKDDNCCICMDEVGDPKKLDCGHVFCRGCIDEAFKHQPKCPSCGRIFGMLKGNQPDGKMSIKKERYMDLQGYRDCGALVITYDIPDGVQGADHPNPGQRFHGTLRTAYLPGNTEGEEVCHLLQRAFEAKLIFTIGKSNTTGRDNVVIWNDIHHKTSTSGQYGYPDPTYLQRVKDELAAKGIKSDAAARAASSVDRSGRNSIAESVNSATGSATGGYSASPYDNHFSSLPVNRAYDVHSRDFGAPSSLISISGWESARVASSHVDRSSRNSVDNPANSTTGSATGGYGVSHHDDYMGFASLPITTSFDVHSRDSGAPSSLMTASGRGSSSSYSADVAGVHTASNRSPVYTSSPSYNPRSHLSLYSSLPPSTSTSLGISFSSSASGTGGYNLRSSSGASSSASKSLYSRKY